MGAEIERKFLIHPNALDRPWENDGLKKCIIRQGYLKKDPDGVVRVRLSRDDSTENAYLTIKGETIDGHCSEFEYAIPGADGREILRLCGNQTIAKTRYRVPHAGKIWEVDLFSGANQGLVLAEIELSASDEIIEIPDWAGQEVTGDARYFNACLIDHPWSEWAGI